MKPEQNHKCSNCSHPVQGKFCSHCGEKVLDPKKDFSFLHFAEETLEGFTHLDTKLLRSFKYLLFKPGYLSLENVNGKRTPYFKPIQFFIILSIAFFIIFPSASSFFANANDMIRGYEEHNYGNLIGFDMQSKVNEIVSRKSISSDEAIQQIHQKASVQSKTYLLILIPFWSLFFYFLFYRKRTYFVEHLIFSTHNISFFILLDIMFIAVFKFVLQADFIGDKQLYFLFLVYLLYIGIAVRKFYGCGFFQTAIKSIAACCSFILLLIVYRQLITMWSAFLI